MRQFEKFQIFSVLGMHRSGTSALAGALAHAGISFGANLMDAAPGENDKGFWEDQKMVWLHDRLLGAICSSWDDIRQVENEKLNSLATHSARTELYSYIESLSTANHTLGLKDPRIAVLLPIWRTLINAPDKQFHFLISVRSPYEVIASLSRRDQFHPTKSALLYIKYYLAAERGTRGVKRAAIEYSDLVKSPVETLHKIAIGLGFPVSSMASGWEDAVKAYISPDLRRNKASAIDEHQGNPAASLANDLYHALSEYTINSLPIPEEIINDITRKAKALTTAKAISYHISDLSKRAEATFLKNILLEEKLNQQALSYPVHDAANCEKTTCQLFISCDEAFQESKSLQQSIIIGIPTTVTFENCEALVTHNRVRLRLDPSCCSGLVSIQEIVAKVRLKGSETDHVQTLTPLTSSRTMIHVDASAAEWLALDDDPQLYLSDLTIPENASWRVQVTLTISKSPESIAAAADLIKAVQKAREEEAARLEQELSASRASTDSRLIEEQQKNTDLGKTLLELTEQLDRLKKLSQSDSAEQIQQLQRTRASHAAELADLERRRSELQFSTEELKTRLANVDLAHEKAMFLLNQELAAVRRSKELEVTRERESHESTKRLFSCQISEKDAALKASGLRVDALQRQLDTAILQAASEMKDQQARHEVTKRALTREIVEKDHALKLSTTRIDILERRLNEAKSRSAGIEQERLRLASLFEELNQKHQLVVESLLAQNEALHQLRERSNIASIQLKELRAQEVSLRISLERTQQAFAEIQNRPLVKLDALLRKASVHTDDSLTNEHHHHPVI